MARPVLKGKTIVLGITGSIAAYKSMDLIRKLIEEGGDVHVVMTKNACHFITPLTVQTLSQNPVAIDMFSLKSEAEIGHIKIARMADIVVVAPATANIMAKVAHGIADDYLSTIILATKAPVMFCPAMNPAMYENPATMENIETLRKRGFYILEPEEGLMACGEEGKGKFPSVDTIVDAISAFLTPQTLKGVKVLVSAGPTREFFDPVRFISNPSSGKMGYAIADAAVRRGAEVHLVSGPVNIKPPWKTKLYNVTSAMEMYDLITTMAPQMDIIIMAAAVGDYRPEEQKTCKIKRTSDCISLTLVPNPDIIAEVGKKKPPGQITVGFAAETEDIIKNATLKLERKNLDMIVANDITRPDSGFCTDTNKVKIICKGGKIIDLPCLTKDEVAEKLLDLIEDIRNGRNS